MLQPIVELVLVVRVVEPVLLEAELGVFVQLRDEGQVAVHALDLRDHLPPELDRAPSSSSPPTSRTSSGAPPSAMPPASPHSSTASPSTATSSTSTPPPGAIRTASRRRAAPRGPNAARRALGRDLVGLRRYRVRNLRIHVAAYTRQVAPVSSSYRERIYRFSLGVTVSWARACPGCRQGRTTGSSSSSVAFSSDRSWARASAS